MTSFDYIIVSGGIGLLIGLFVRRKEHKAQIKELEQWNSTALVHICEVEDEKEQLQAELNEVKARFADHCLNFDCVRSDEVLEAEFVE